MKTPLKSHRHVASMCLRNTLTIGPVGHPNPNKVKLLLFLAVLGVLVAFLLVGDFFRGCNIELGNTTYPKSAK